MSPRLLEQAPPMTGWMGAPDPFAFDATSLAMAADARRYTQSTMSYASVAGLTVAVEQLLAAGPASIESHAKKLARLLTEAAGQCGWTPFRPPGSRDGCAHIVTLSHPERSVDAVRRQLAEQRIVCSARGGRIRVSIAPYNDENDIDAIAGALK
jgi:selenocysteine lyase/cysteine desulfurase